MTCNDMWKHMPIPMKGHCQYANAISRGGNGFAPRSVQRSGAKPFPVYFVKVHLRVVLCNLNYIRCCGIYGTTRIYSIYSYIQHSQKAFPPRIYSIYNISCGHFSYSSSVWYFKLKVLRLTFELTLARNHLMVLLLLSANTFWLFTQLCGLMPFESFVYTSKYCLYASYRIYRSSVCTLSYIILFLSAL